MRSASKKPRLRTKGDSGMSEPRYPSEKPVAEGHVPEYADAFSDALNDLMAKHWQEGT